MRSKFLIASSLLMSLLFVPALKGAEEDAIRKKSAEYVTTYNRADARGLATFWAEDAEYYIPDTGDTLEGRREIEDMFRSLFERQKYGRLDVKIKSITFPSNNQAVETGTATLTVPGEDPDMTVYRAIYTKKNGEWLLSRVREIEIGGTPTENTHLKDLQWLVGEWVDEDQDSKIETKAEWDKYKNFLTQHFVVTLEGNVVLEGKQIIGWDPVNQKIRSWVFDSDGGFGEGTWKKTGSTWVVESNQTLGDGRPASAINIYTPINQSSFKWESTGREIGGELLPNLEPVTVQRKKG